MKNIQGIADDGTRNNKKAAFSIPVNTVIGSVW
jgi:hypothetical protein